MEKDYDLVFYTGTIDQFFDYEYGRLSYRTVYWEKQICEGYFQGNAVVNYTTEDKPFTRINEPIYFEPWKNNLPKGKSIYLKSTARLQNKAMNRIIQSDALKISIALAATKKNLN